MTYKTLQAEMVDNSGWKSPEIVCTILYMGIIVGVRLLLLTSKTSTVQPVIDEYRLRIDILEDD